MFISAIKERFKDRLDDKLVKESINKLRLQCAIQKEIYSHSHEKEYSCDDFLLNKAKSDFDDLSWKSLREFNFINELISREIL